MRFFFCDSVFDSKLVEPDYKEEFNSAKQNGLKVSLISFEQLNEGEALKAIESIPVCEKLEQSIYRGWMLTPKVYENFYYALLKKNIELINNPIEYKYCHFLPESYTVIEALTPKSNWTRLITEEKVNSLTDEFEESPVVVKDFVKSEKHNWENACFIKDASDKEEVKRVVDNFLELRGEFLNEGIVFRKFEKLEFLTNHSKSSMPLTKEFRLFFLNQQLFSQYNYWDEGEYGDVQVDLKEFVSVAENISSNFFTMDIAKKEDGSWIIMELGDAQVSGLPENADKNLFYKQLLDFF